MNTGKPNVLGTALPDAGEDIWHAPCKIDVFDKRGQVSFAQRPRDANLSSITVEALDRSRSSDLLNQLRKRRLERELPLLFGLLGNWTHALGRLPGFSQS